MKSSFTLAEVKLVGRWTAWCGVVCIVQATWCSLQGHWEREGTGISKGEGQGVV